MKFKKITAIALAAVMSVATIAGCGEMDKNKTIATLGDEKVTLGLANFFARYNQAINEEYTLAYYKYFGYSITASEFWSTDSGDGVTMEESSKNEVMENIHAFYTLRNHMSDYGVSFTEEDQKAVNEVAAKFIAANSEEALDELGATEEIVAEYLELYTIYSRMSEKIYAEADTNVSDEEANMRAFDRIYIGNSTHTDEDGNSVEYTDEEKAENKAKAKELLGKLKDDSSLSYEDEAKEYGFTYSTSTYDSDDTSLAGELKTALDGLKEGDDPVLVETDSALYIVRITAETDKEATEENRESIIEKRKSDHFNEVLEGWQKDDGWDVDEDVLAEIKFDDSFTTTVETEGTEGSEETEASETTETTEGTTETEGTEAQ